MRCDHCSYVIRCEAVEQQVATREEQPEEQAMDKKAMEQQVATREEQPGEQPEEQAMDKKA
jgi:hypothetical protein